MKKMIYHKIDCLSFTTIIKATYNVAIIDSSYPMEFFHQLTFWKTPAARPGNLVEWLVCCMVLSANIRGRSFFIILWKVGLR